MKKTKILAELKRENILVFFYSIKKTNTNYYKIILNKKGLMKFFKKKRNYHYFGKKNMS